MTIRPDFQPGAPLPESLGACADLCKEIEAVRLAVQKKVDDMKKRESEIRDHIINNLPKGDRGAAGQKYSATVVTKQVPRVADWTALWDYIFKTQSTDMLQKRISDKVVKEVWDAGETVPGVEPFNAVEVSFRKL